MAAVAIVGLLAATWAAYRPATQSHAGIALGTATGVSGPGLRLRESLLSVPSYPVSAQVSLDGEHFILISKDAKRLTVYRRVRSFTVATGRNSGDKRSVGDCRTPETPPGSLYPVSRKLVTPEGSPFGPRFIGLSTPPWRGIAIHGTDDPGSIGTDASHGCVRLANPDIRWLFDGVRVGDGVVISP